MLSYEICEMSPLTCPYFQTILTAIFAAAVIALVIWFIIKNIKKRSRAMTKCPKCEAEVAEADSFCGNCGAKLSQPENVPNTPEDAI